MRGWASPLWAPGMSRLLRPPVSTPHCSVSVLKVVTVQRAEEPGTGTPGTGTGRDRQADVCGLRGGQGGFHSWTEKKVAFILGGMGQPRRERLRGGTPGGGCWHQKAQEAVRMGRASLCG